MAEREQSKRPLRTKAGSAVVAVLLLLMEKILDKSEYLGF
jgi:hypothetical protein